MVRSETNHKKLFGANVFIKPLEHFNALFCFGVSIMQPLKFIIVGIFNTLLTFLIYFACYSILSINYFVSLIISYFIGVLNSYLWNSKWTFEKKALRAVEFSKFITVYIAAFLINAIMLRFLIVYDFKNMLAQGLALFIATLFSFCGHKYWSLRKNEKVKKSTILYS